MSKKPHSKIAQTTSSDSLRQPFDVRASDIASGVSRELRAAGCVFAEEEAALLIVQAKNQEELGRMVQQRASGLPLEHILGWAEFLGHKITVGPDTFVPRKRSEYLATQALQLTRPHDVVVDIGCGTGALAVVVAASVADIELYASDIDPTEVEYAHRNLSIFAAHVVQGEYFRPLPISLRGRIDVVIANLPYVPTTELDHMPREARLYEPAVALDGGPDGLDLQRRLAREALQWLTPGGQLLVEASVTQAPLSAQIFADNGLASRIAISDELNVAVIIAARPDTPFA